MTPDQIIINMCTSMGYCDHMGDVESVVWHALDELGIIPPKDEVSDLSELSKWLCKHYRATTIWGTPVYEGDPNQQEAPINAGLDHTR